MFLTVPQGCRVGWHPRALADRQCFQVVFRQGEMGQQAQSYSRRDRADAAARQRKQKDMTASYTKRKKQERENKPSPREHALQWNVIKATATGKPSRFTRTAKERNARRLGSRCRVPRSRYQPGDWLEWCLRTKLVRFACFRVPKKVVGSTRACQGEEARAESDVCGEKKKGRRRELDGGASARFRSSACLRRHLACESKKAIVE
jgi:hypothetical protein